MAILGIMIIAGIFDAVSTQQASALPVSADVNQLTENEPLSASELGGPDIGLQIPSIGPNVFSVIGNSLTWNHSYFTAEWQMFRFVFAFLSWGAILWQLGLATTVIAILHLFLDIARFALEAVAGAVGVLRRLG